MGAATRLAVEDFLYGEAALLDAWKLMEWADLFTGDGEYLVPSTDLPPGADARSNLYLVYDDRFRLGERAKRLLKRTAHAEFPPSKTRHLISNVRLVAETEGMLEVSCAYVVYRSKREILDIYPGCADYRLVIEGGSFRIRRKCAMLDLDALRPQGKVSIIL
ncbi:MAG TPA: aromatic-ring-hydroxylating dioxygenase subunit beta [Candidatus Sulfotelmatobacter sp.]|nr:aromatic-ring-hydroxylating dioxygenase subunit beta [Candidatus Sulfotelmatobacter sp.]